MIVRVELEGRHYDCVLSWEPVIVPPGGNVWWLQEIRGQPRPQGDQVREIYRRALELAERAMRADRGESER